MKSWLKGGLIGGIVGLSWTLIFYLLPNKGVYLVSLYALMPFYYILPNSIYTFFVNNYVNFLFIILEGFIIGTIIGLIIQKIKNQKVLGH